MTQRPPEGCTTERTKHGQYLKWRDEFPDADGTGIETIDINTLSFIRRWTPDFVGDFSYILGGAAAVPRNYGNSLARNMAVVQFAKVFDAFCRECEISPRKLTKMILDHKDEMDEMCHPDDEPITMKDCIRWGIRLCRIDTRARDKRKAS
jgi:hypothetical protein